MLKKKYFCDNIISVMKINQGGVYYERKSKKNKKA